VSKKISSGAALPCWREGYCTRMPFCSFSTLFVSGFMMRDVESILARFSEVMEQMTCIRAVFEKVPAP